MIKAGAGAGSDARARRLLDQVFDAAPWLVSAPPAEQAAPTF
ncbi:hypothetical protein [Streptomyces sp. NBC_01198]|nr:hypothetical protein OG702_03210 [Streptomyces sp. NBC_01198]